jgi:alpha,alpha-trehalose phosphorylase
MLRFAPRLPPALTRLAFTVVTGGRRLRVEATPQHGHLYAVRRRPPVQIGHHGQPIMLTDGCAETRDIPPLPDRPEPTQPPGREPARCTPPGP